MQRLAEVLLHLSRLSSLDVSGMFCFRPCDERVACLLFACLVTAPGAGNDLGENNLSLLLSALTLAQLRQMTSLNVHGACGRPFASSFCAFLLIARWAPMCACRQRNQSGGGRDDRHGSFAHAPTDDSRCGRYTLLTAWDGCTFPWVTPELISVCSGPTGNQFALSDCTMLCLELAGLTNLVELNLQGTQPLYP